MSHFKFKPASLHHVSQCNVTNETESRNPPNFFSSYDISQAADIDGIRNFKITLTLKRITVVPSDRIVTSHPSIEQAKLDTCGILQRCFAMKKDSSCITSLLSVSNNAKPKLMMMFQFYVEHDTFQCILSGLSGRYHQLTEQ